MNKHIRIISVSALALLGILCIASGIMYSSLQANNIEEKILVVVEQKQVSTDTDVNIKLKNLTIEVNTPLSVKIIDYLDSAVSDEVLANLKLDTSSVNVTEPGTYNYTITYKEKIYQGREYQMLTCNFDEGQLPFMSKSMEKFSETFKKQLAKNPIFEAKMTTNGEVFQKYLANPKYCTITHSKK